MQNQPIYQRKVLTVEILTDRDAGDMDIPGVIDRVLNYACSDFSIKVEEVKTETLTPMKIAEALESQDSDRGFLMGEKCREDQPHTAVKFDLEFHGGDYTDTGEFVYIPNDFIEDQPTVEEAFRVWTGHDTSHIVTIYLDEEYTSDGEPWNE